MSNELVPIYVPDLTEWLRAYPNLVKLMKFDTRLLYRSCSYDFDVQWMYYLARLNRTNRGISLKDAANKYFNQR